MSQSEANSFKTNETLNRSAWQNFEREVQSLEDLLASQNHTLESFASKVFENSTGNPELDARRERAGKKIAELYRLREFLRTQFGQDTPKSSGQYLSPNKFRRLARV
jgi:hypothetical protein